jgi:hypothetical protein
MSKVIEVIVSPDGVTRVETRGFSGSVCRDASRFIESALGKSVSEHLTPEFHQAANTQQQKTQH